MYTIGAAFTSPTVGARFIAPVCHQIHVLTHGRRERGPYGGRAKSGPYEIILDFSIPIGYNVTNKISVTS